MQGREGSRALRAAAAAQQRANARTLAPGLGPPCARVIVRSQVPGAQPHPPATTLCCPPPARSHLLHPSLPCIQPYGCQVVALLVRQQHQAPNHLGLWQAAQAQAARGAVVALTCKGAVGPERRLGHSLQGWAPSPHRWRRLRATATLPTASSFSRARRFKASRLKNQGPSFWVESSPAADGQQEGGRRLGKPPSSEQPRPRAVLPSAPTPSSTAIFSAPERHRSAGPSAAGPALHARAGGGPAQSAPCVCGCLHRL